MTPIIKPRTVPERILDVLTACREPLTIKQLAERVGTRLEYAQTATAALLEQGTLKRRRSWKATRPYEYMRADATFPELPPEAAVARTIRTRGAKRSRSTLAQLTDSLRS